MARVGKARLGKQLRSNGKSQSARIENYEDTLQEGGVDDYIFKRDQIFLDDWRNVEDQDDIDIGTGERVLDIPSFAEPSSSDGESDDKGAESSRSGKKRAKAPISDAQLRGRFAKEAAAEVDVGDEIESSGDEEEGWGRQYYSKPSNRRAREDPQAYEASREEERELEVNEVRRLQKKARLDLRGTEDWGFDPQLLTTEIDDNPADDPVATVVEAPDTEDTSTLLRHLESHETLKLALAREMPLVIEKLQKTSRGMQTQEGSRNAALQRGLGWLHYQVLLSYATVLAFYLHLCALPRESRPDLADHPIMSRLLHLKEGLAMLEDLDFAADSESGVSDEEFEEGVNGSQKAMKDKLSLLFGAFNDKGSSQIEDDLDESWRTTHLEEGELDELLADLTDGEPEVIPVAEPKRKPKGHKRSQLLAADPVTNALVEPDFQSMEHFSTTQSNEDPIGDPSALDEADAVDKENRKRSLQFHTSKINSTSARRAAARAQRFGGDDDIPQRDRQAARDAALRRSGPAAQPESDTLSSQWLQESGEDSVPAASDNAEYYDLVRRDQSRKKAARTDARQQAVDSNQRFEEDVHKGGPRALTRAIEKNRGLTPRRAKTNRNPRVKKRLAYDKAKRKVSSQGPVYKGGQSSLQGRYSGETSGISNVVRSKRF
ncbi:Sas10 C-terminal domain-domain-containing protein [Kockovaella imperatae]|uniref:Sas10 C-terminal domain-domain-containing protein n=1 Tax=Kockovaella imperatae TaxID=4999 RepID=A0A1Y1UI74_9TREE|nr:Sas10 C-terminal domain-domain-containing protein [Kockovaella imperatae]ORX37186.1 Sas10 C-terminal domain-domain-containing protein [Kockovaella imperatae]